MNNDQTDSFYKTIGIDFDGVIHQYEGWCDVENPPIPGAFEAIRELHERYNLFVFCARQYGDGPGNLNAIPAWFEKYELGIEAVCEKDHSHFWNDRRILVTNTKLPAVAYIDDRAVRFESWEQTKVALGVILG